ncbi:mycofactocin biosynthesis peptidyl-dipeptidase MftE [Nocardia veterana]|uniref:Mycofactocin biosynthesis peptidyl-dipeptidase MftE n=1 Tax=Nocardia veterana TaxID=132249 RepID=A0A7X6M3B9_9NOCA|nr:mycofactocin biosynthesis peptidyl-dipeptidase MftE [Nocardia veterana]NKY89608.1 mycofactocin biosynthesis peptidyl-dipeptidase MftE [Nocardia veterana]
MHLADLTSAQLADLPRPLLAVPLGATEQHGPHLPLGTDTAIAVELCRRLARARGDVVVAPPIPYGSSGEHAGFPGTLSIGRAALELVVVELVRSADEFGAVILVNGHGGNLQPLRAAQHQLAAENRDILIWSPTGPTDDSHAGHTETSTMLHLAPELVVTDRIRPGNTRPLHELMPHLRTGGVRAVSATGVLGDPTHATAAAGVRLLDRWADALTTAVANRFPPADPGF